MAAEEEPRAERQEPRRRGGPREEGFRGHADGQDPGGGYHVRGAAQEGFLYPAFILDDVHPRRIVGWAMEDRPRTEPVVDAPRTAACRRKPTTTPGLVHHSEQGAQYTALSFSERLKELGITPSMGRTGSALDDAMAESFVSTSKAELVGRLGFPSRQAARTAIFEYLETFCDTRRLHSSLGYRSPADFEEDRIGEASVA